MENWPIQHPTTTVEPGLKGKEALESLFEVHKVQPNVQDWYHQVEEALRVWNEEIWANIGKNILVSARQRKHLHPSSPRSSVD